MTSLVFFGYLTFMGTGRGEQPALLYSLVPLLLWAALRLGLKGVSTSMVVVALLSIWGASHGRGPFAEGGPLNNALSLQLFLFFAAIPFTILAVVLDERKRAQEVLRESEERFRMAAQAGKMFAYEWDVSTDKIVRSEGVAQILGVNEGTVTTGQHIFTMVPPQDRERLTAAVAKLSAGEPSLQISYRMVRSDGTVIWVERNSRADFDEQGRMMRMIGMVADITA
jgi:PAS domain S-box-containing protein